jgi:hypothetical protein
MPDNGQAERMNRTVKDATIKAFHYPSLDVLRAHVLAFIAAYNFAKHLKALRWRTPFQAICDAWAKEPAIFKINPNHLIPGPSTYDRGNLLNAAAYHNVAIEVVHKLAGQQGFQVLPHR